MTQIDPQMTAAVVTGLFMFGCVVLLYFMRDTRSSPPHRVTRTIWCPTHQRQVRVDFSERISTGMPIRKVERCSLRDGGKRCDETCVNEVGMKVARKDAV